MPDAPHPPPNDTPEPAPPTPGPGPAPDSAAAGSTGADVAREHLRTIRSLMERATVYRTLSGPAALAGGVLASLAGFGILLTSGVTFVWAPGDWTFILVWLAVLLVCTALNLALLARESRHRGDPFWSPGMRTALKAIAPPMLTTGLLGLAVVHFERNLELCVLLWIAGYGLALLAAGHFAPRAIRLLGLAFVFSSLALTLFYHLSGGLGFWPNPVTRASLFMGLTFGLLHVLYGGLVVIRGRRPGGRA